MSDLKYIRILQAMTATPWAILPAKLAIIQELLTFRAMGGELTADEVRERMEIEAARRGDVQRRQSAGAVAVLPLVGTIIPRADLITESSGAISAQRFTAAFRAAMADPDVSAIILDVDSPGGQVGGVPELAAEIFAARGEKRVTAVVNTLAASAAYWIASASEEIVITPSGQAGSIGVIAMHRDVSAMNEKLGVNITLITAGKYKAEANPFEPLGEEGRGAIQAVVNDYYGMFVDTVAQGRGVSPRDVRGGFGEGRVLGADDAVREGLADRIATLDDVISESLGASPINKPAATSDLEMRERRLRLLGR